MLLRFRVINHKSIRDEAELSLAAPTLKGQVPSDGDWRAATTRVAAIYGANASGKSTVLDAIDFLCKAIKFSATRWLEREEFPHHPFILDKNSKHQTSLYEIDLVFGGIRYTYGFEADATGVASEWLYSYPSRKRRILFERARNPVETFFGRSLPGENSAISRLVRPTSLLLSVATNANHEVLGSIHRAITRSLRYARVGDDDRRGRLSWVIDHLKGDQELQADTEALLRVADLGISRIEIVKQELPSFLAELYRSIANVEQVKGAMGSLEEFLESSESTMRFFHDVDGAAGEQPLQLSEESDGTVAWLSLAVPALHALRYGETLLIDEVGASLHPILTAELVRIFKDPDLNGSGGQLVFTSHDTTLMGHLLGGVLAREEVWFTEKASDGNTQLYALEEFSVRDSDNYEKRYLEGRYGAVPLVQEEELRSVLVGRGSADE